MMYPTTNDTEQDSRPMGSEFPADPAIAIPLDDEASGVRVRGLRKTFQSRGETVVALDNVSFSVGPSEIFVLLGSSGCGKTTLLRAIAGLEDPDEGEIWIERRCVYSSTRKLDLPPERRGVSFVFQSYALWPHMTVLKNVTFPLRASGVGRREARVRGEEALGIVHCEGLGHRYPSELSGGQQQRVALARAMIAGRRLIFFDEPLSNIDAKVREELRIELLSIREAVGLAGVYVTHDQDEAMILGDRIAVMDRGRILQIGTPREIYERPATRWVADFVGSANFIEGTVVARERDSIVLSSSLGDVRGAPSSQLDVRLGQTAAVFFRPSWGSIVDAEIEGANCWPCVVKQMIYTGDRIKAVVAVAGQDFLVVATKMHESGDRGWLHVPVVNARVLLH